jgi:nucleoside-diphosphate-sugar epimerase
MKVLLTGASGFIGRHVLAALVGAGIETVMVGRTPPSVQPPGRTGHALIRADLLDPNLDMAALMDKAEASHLVHLAWYAEHGLYWSSPLNLRWLDASLRLIEAFCQKGGKHVTLAGTCAEYDWQWGYCREDATPAEPATLYGAAKDALRRVVPALCARHGVRWTWGRLFLPYGRGEAQARLLPSLASAFAGHSPPFAIDAEAFRDFLHVADAASAFVFLCRHPSAQGIFNLASGQPIRLGDAARLLAASLGADPEPLLRLAAPRPGEPRLLVGANDKLLHLGWQPRFSLSAGLAEAYGPHQTFLQI